MPCEGRFRRRGLGIPKSATGQPSTAAKLASPSSEGELRDGVAQLHSPRLAQGDGGAKRAHQRPAGANAKRWEKPIARRLINCTTFYRLDQRANRAAREPK